MERSRRVGVLVEVDGAVHEIAVRIGPDGSRVSDVVRALDPGAPPGTSLEVDGRPWPADRPVDALGLVHGVRVRLRPPGGAPTGPAVPPAPSAEPAPAPVWHLAVVAGPAAGRLVALPTGRVTVGRDPDAQVSLHDPSVSWHHAQLEVGPSAVRIGDLGSANGTWVEGAALVGVADLVDGAQVRVGASWLELRGAPPDDRATAADPVPWNAVGTLAFHRPPRPRTRLRPEPIAVPEPPAPPGSTVALDAAAVIAPLALAGALIALGGDLRFALFALLTPVLALSRWATQRRRVRRARRTSERRWRDELRRFDAHLAAAAERERCRRRAARPDLAEIVRRATTPSASLWERRLEDDDALRLRLGTGEVPWDPPVQRRSSAVDLHPGVEAVIARHRTLTRCPVELDLRPGQVVGLIGDRAARVALARALLCQAAVHHGPADVRVVVVADDPAAWSWVAWLPHVRGPQGRRWLASTVAQGQELLARLAAAGPRRAGATSVPGGSLVTAPPPAAPPTPVTLVVLDLGSEHGAQAGELLRATNGPVAALVLADHDAQLPAACTVVAELLDDLGSARVRHLDTGVTASVATAGLPVDTAARTARALARFEDPERPDAGPGAGALPATVRLLDLLDLDPDPAAIAERWAGAPRVPALATPIGIGPDGPVVVDLVRDGPHGLVGGTTGSGKSELLRTLVAGLATQLPPEQLTFLLLDYKGGSAFDACGRLPHVLGVVTDLDEHLAARALTSVRAELARRERILRDVGATDLPGYLTAGAPLGPLPRLVVVVDEFATLARELPTFVSDLIAVAQRGRSLGVHLLLATQRPSGAVDAEVRANTNLRIALRVQDPVDSQDVVDVPDAAAIDPATPGRAWVRLGPAALVPAQTARCGACPPPADTGEVTVRPVRFGPWVTTQPDGAGRSATGDGPGPDAGAARDAAVAAGPTDLERLVGAIATAAADTARPAPRPVWLPPLPDRLDPAALAAATRADAPDEGGGPSSTAAHDEAVVFALADAPAEQRQVPVGWRLQAGPLALVGTAGSGTTTALRAVAATLASTRSPRACHLHVLDGHAGTWTDLAPLPHVGAVVGVHEHERLHRLLRRLRRELDRRRALAPDERATLPRIVLLVDALPAVLAEHGAPDDHVTEDLARLMQEGTAVGLHVALTADRPGALPARVVGSIAQRWLFAPADPTDLAVAGLRGRDVPRFVPGRAVLAAEGLVAQVVDPAPLLDATLRRHAARRRGGHEARFGVPAEPGLPADVTVLPDEVGLDELPAATRGPVDHDEVRVTVGLDHDLEPAVFALAPAEHALVAGPPRSGRTTLLATLATALRDQDPQLVLVGVCRPGGGLAAVGALDAVGSPTELAGLLAAGRDDPRRWVVLVDDADRLADPDGALAELLACARPGLHVVAAGAPEPLRTAYDGWLRALRGARTGVLLQPDLVVDGDLLAVRLPRRVHVPWRPGRGFLVAGGRPRLVHVARPDRPSSTGTEQRE